MLKNLLVIAAVMIMLGSCAQKIVPADGANSTGSYSSAPGSQNTGGSGANNAVNTSTTVEVKADEMKDNVKASGGTPPLEVR